jgi:hypothetical protein
MKSWQKVILIVLILLVVVVPIGVYYGLPIIQPCALLSRVLPPSLLPPNPNVSDLPFEPLPGARAMTGEVACSGYRIEIPDNWNGDLVVYAHGFRAGASPELFVTDLPVREAAVNQGYAWAASTYRANGYNPLDGIEDTRLMIERFKEVVGVPNRILIYGSSMGGHVVVGSLEKYPELYDGGVAECGVVGGVLQLDYLVAANAAADYFAGTNMFAPENRGLRAQIALLDEQIYPALGPLPEFEFDENSLTGIETPAPEVDLTPAGEVYRSVQIMLSGGPRPFAVEGFAGAYAATLLAPRLLYGLLPGGVVTAGSNQDTIYELDPSFRVDVATVNAEVYRLAADPEERAKYSFTGNLQDPLLTIHDTGDLFVPVVNERWYRQMVDAAGNGDLLVQRAVRRFLHCDFSLAERETTFNDLINWVNTGAKPEGEDMLGSFEDIGRAWTMPLRGDDPGNQ